MGTITAPPPGAWSGQNYWMMFYQVQGLTVTGGSTGLLDGRGRSWWWSDKFNRYGVRAQLTSCKKERKSFNSSLHLCL